MTYTPLILSALGIVGILLHNLIKLDSLNRANKGQINLGKYFAIEKFTILISLILTGAAAFILDKEIHYYLDEKGFSKYFGLGFIFLGYFAQSLLVKFTQEGQKYLDKKSKPDTDTP